MNSAGISEQAHFCINSLTADSSGIVPLISGSSKYLSRRNGQRVACSHFLSETMPFCCTFSAGLWYTLCEVMIMSLSKSIGANIKQLRVQKNLSQEDLASVLFVTRQTLSNYETGRSKPDIDMLQKISAALDTDLSCLLYGNSHTPEKKKPRKETVFQISLFAVLGLVSLILYTVTKSLQTNRLNPVSHILVRLIFIPLSMAALGSALLQTIDFFLGIQEPSHLCKKVGKIVTISILVINLIITLPYIIFCIAILFQSLSGADSIAMFFPSIPVYEEVAFFFLSIMYKFPFVYILAGMALWIFFQNKKGGFSRKT